MRLELGQKQAGGCHHQLPCQASVHYTDRRYGWPLARTKGALGTSFHISLSSFLTNWHPTEIFNVRFISSVLGDFFDDGVMAC